MATPLSIDSFEVTPFKPNLDAMANPLYGLHNSFDSSADIEVVKVDTQIHPIGEALSLFTGIQEFQWHPDLRPVFFEQTDNMFYGHLDSNGSQTLGLIEISGWNLNPEYYEMNLKQHAGYAAEVISTAKENLIARITGSDVTAYRVDDMPELGFPKNDQHVDKVRVNAAGEVIERIQTKFFGNNGTEWVQKMMSKKCEKYLDGIHVDKLECPKDYYDEAKAFISQWREDLARQLEHVTANDNTEAIESTQRKIDKLNSIDEMIEQSTVTTDQARRAVTKPKSVMASLFAAETFSVALEEGAYGATAAAGLTFVSSTAIHGAELYNGEITAGDMARLVASETGVAGALGGGTAFVSSAAASMMQTSSCNLIRSIGGSCLPASAVAFTVESYDSFMDYAQGTIGADELAHDLGHNAATILGGAVGGSKIGAVTGSAFGPAGTIAGGLVGGLVGSTVASGAYETAVQYAPGAAKELAEQAGAYAQQAMDVISSEYPKQVDNAKAAFNGFFASHNIPVSL